jgi:hypothetical protein
MSIRIASALVAIALMASAGPALGQAPSLKTASELPIWKTVTVGLHRGVNAVRKAFDDARIAVGDSADEVLGRPAFTFTNERRELDLVVLSVAALGFGVEGGTLADIHARAIQLGFELCPEEVGPHLRLQYLNQPVGEFLHVAMKPQRTYGGDLVDFTLANSGAGLALLGGSARPDLLIPRNVVFVFVRPSTPQVAIVPDPFNPGAGRSAPVARVDD